MATAECRRGHDLTALGRNYRGQCVACQRACKARYNASSNGLARHARYARTPKGQARSARYDATTRGQLSQARRQLKYRLRAKEARLAELENILNAYA